MKSNGINLIQFIYVCFMWFSFTVQEDIKIVNTGLA